MNDVWVCVAGDRKIAIHCEQNALTWHEVRSYAASRLGVDPFSSDFSTHRNPVDGLPSGVEIVEVRWVGDDYAHGGAPGRRRMQCRSPGDPVDQWMDV